MLTWIRNILIGIVVAFFASTILVVVAYKVMPVVVTPLMVIRSVENFAHGKSPFWHHTWVSLKDMSPDMPIAVMASEDQRFLIHHGFDFDAIQKAMKRNEAAGKKKYGASTISQQTAKNVFLWQGRTWLRKGLETYFTVLIEFIWGKERIMEVYLNSIEMGPSIYGVSAVAEENFDGIEAKDLSARQCALIAATLPNPLKFSSKEPSDYMRKRQRFILKQMKFVKWNP
ncbi:MAG: monofunctional biosynthetic peptidoglycan transglycosylase [Prevotella sp.]|nr:monofunctional biosynthetic peptidoglycan transglycosylase [Prevotella sp.]